MPRKTTTFDALLDRVREHPDTRAEEPVTKKRATEVARELGVTFPADFVRFHVQLGGGEYPFARMRSLLHAPRPTMPFAVGPRVVHAGGGSCELAEHYNLFHGVPGADPKLGALIPFGDDWGGNPYCFDSSEEDEPSVVSVDHETNETSLVARSFAQFIEEALLEAPPREPSAAPSPFPSAAPGPVSSVPPKPAAAPLRPTPVVPSAIAQHTVLFDANRPRSVGEVARHSVFEMLAIRATIDPLPADASIGLAVRLSGKRGTYEVTDVSLVDPDDRALSGSTGFSSIQDEESSETLFRVYVAAPAPLPAGARLRVIVQELSSPSSHP